MDRYEALKNLMVMAAADGSFAEREMKFSADRCHRWGLTEGQFASAIEYSLSPAAKLTLPESDGERRGMLRELIGMMAADGQLAEIEKQLFSVMAAQMDMTAEELNHMIDSLLSEREAN